MQTEKEEPLFVEDTVYISSKTTAEEVIKEISDKLLEKGLVKPEFYENVIGREKDYPTGIDLGVVNEDLPNIAIPHTEGEFVNVRRVIPVHLENPVTFKNMIDPSSSMEVKFLFMILNNDPEGQSNILAQIMNFCTTTSANDLGTFFKSTDTKAIYQFLNRSFADQDM